MFLRWSACLLACLSSCVVPAVNADFAEVCDDTSHHQPQDVRRTALMQRKQELRVIAPKERAAGPRAVRLLLSEMEGLADRKGIDGLDPEEVQHIETIKGLIADTIIPSILDGAEEARQEIAELYDAILNCTQRVMDDLEMESTMHTEVESNRDAHRECRKLEDEVIKEKDRVCQQFNITRMSIQLPSGEMPGLDASDATMIQYLKDMDEYFCGRMQAFEDEWEECENLTKNYTDTNRNCTTLQQDLEESWCTWMTELDGTCGGLSTCWETTVARFNERKNEIEQLVADRKEALAAATKVQCLWDAWEWDSEPCTVNETKVKECKDIEPNTTAVEVDMPPPPPRPPCNMSEEGFFPCNEAFIGSEYASLDVSQALIDEMKAACSACPPRPEAAAEEEPPAIRGITDTVRLLVNGEVIVEFPLMEPPRPEDLRMEVWLMFTDDAETDVAFMYAGAVSDEPTQHKLQLSNVEHVEGTKYKVNQALGHDSSDGGAIAADEAIRMTLRPLDVNTVTVLHLAIKVPSGEDFMLMAGIMGGKLQAEWPGLDKKEVEVKVGDVISIDMSGMPGDEETADLVQEREAQLDNKTRLHVERSNVTKNAEHRAGAMLMHDKELPRNNTKWALLGRRARR